MRPVGNFLSIMRNFLTLLFRVFSTFVSYHNSTIYKFSKDDRLKNSKSTTCRFITLCKYFFLVEKQNNTFTNASELTESPKMYGIIYYPMVSTPNLKNVHPVAGSSIDIGHNCMEYCHNWALK